MDFETEGVFFFAARLSADVDPDTPLNPVRFVLPEMDPPAYPLRLTRLGVLDDDSLELTLWVISPEGRYLPVSHGWDQLIPTPANRQEYDLALKNLYSQQTPAANLALLYRKPLDHDLLIYRQVCGDMGCMSFDELGVDAPESWCPEIEEVRDSFAWVNRLQGKLTAYNMRDDLALGPIGDSIYTVSNIYYEWACDTKVASMSCLVLLTLGLLIRRRY